MEWVTPPLSSAAWPAALNAVLEALCGLEPVSLAI